MMQKFNTRWFWLIAANTAVWCVLSFYGTSGAAPQGARQPFSNATEQRQEIVRQLEEIKALLKEQNALLQKSSDQSVKDDRPSNQARKR